MKLIILSVAFLGIFQPPVVTSNNIIENNQGNAGGDSHQTVSIDNKRQVVNVDNNNGWDSWSTVLDYRTGYMAIRLLSKKSCFITKMNKQIMPDIATLPKAIQEKQKDYRKGPAPKEVSLTVSHKTIPDLSVYGKQVETFCRGIPSYFASEVKRPSFFFSEGSCARANILYLIFFSFCQEVAFD